MKKTYFNPEDTSGMPKVQLTAPRGCLGGPGVPREGQIGPISLFSSQIKKSQDLSSSPGRVMNSIDEDD